MSDRRQTRSSRLKLFRLLGFGAALALTGLQTTRAQGTDNGTAPPASSRIFGLHITDLHIDDKFVPTADPNTFCHGPSSSPGHGRLAINARKPAPYGYRACDSSPVMVADTFRFLSANFGLGRDNGSMVFGDDGTNREQQGPPRVNGTLPVDRLSFVLWTGDTGRHDKDLQLPRQEEEVYRSNREAIEHFMSAFNISEIAVVPSIGNWDTFPADLMTPEKGHVMQNLYEIWSPLFQSAPASDNISETFLLPSSGGFYQRTIAPGLVVLSINSLWFFGRNTAVGDCQFPGPVLKPIPGDEQLAWMERKLKEAKENNFQVIIIGHIAPLERDGYIYKPRCYVAFLNLLGKFAAQIISAHFGHTNEDSMQFVAELLPDENPGSFQAQQASGVASARKQSEMDYIFLSSSIAIDLNHTKVLVPLFTSPSIIPVWQPTFRVLDLAYGAPQATAWTLKGWSQYAADLVKANWMYERNRNNTIEYFEEYHTSVYGLPDLAAESIMKFLPRFLSNDEGVADQYEAFSTVSGFVPFVPPDLDYTLKLPRWVLVVFTFSAVAMFIAAMAWVLNFMFETTVQANEFESLLANKDEFDDGD